MLSGLNSGVDWLSDNLPGLFAALALFAVGWLVAHVVRRTIKRAAAAVDPDAAGHWPRLFASAGMFIYWLILLAFGIAALAVARNAAPGGWVERIGEYVPHLLAGALILIGGALLSFFARDLVLRWLAPLGLEQAHLFARIIQVIVLVTAFVVGIEQLGIHTTFLVTMLAIVTSGMVLAVGLAFAIGAADLVRNLVGARDARRHYHSGQRVQVGDCEGEIVEISPTVLVLATPRGRVTIPARVFHEANITLLSVEADHG